MHRCRALKSLHPPFRYSFPAGNMHERKIAGIEFQVCFEIGPFGKRGVDVVFE